MMERKECAEMEINRRQEEGAKASSVLDRLVAWNSTLRTHREAISAAAPAEEGSPENDALVARYQECQDILTHLQAIHMSVPFLKESKVGFIVKKFTKQSYAPLAKQAKDLIAQWQRFAPSPTNATASSTIRAPTPPATVRTAAATASKIHPVKYSVPLEARTVKAELKKTLAVIQSWYKRVRMMGIKPRLKKSIKSPWNVTVFWIAWPGYNH
jgi:hypothetical protein